MKTVQILNQRGIRMKPKTLISVAVVIVITLMMSISNTFAQREVKSTGIGVRGSYWRMNNEPTQVVVSSSGENVVNIGGAGGWLNLYSRVNNYLLLEFSIGAIGKVEDATTTYTNNEVEAFAITPLLLGFRLGILSPKNQSSLHPYISFGGGPYWVSNLNVKERLDEEEVNIHTNLFRGAYAGGGFNFLLSDWIAVNFDLRYHFIDFNVNHEHSGLEYGLGINIMWGKYQQ